MLKSQPLFCPFFLYASQLFHAAVNYSDSVIKAAETTNHHLSLLSSFAHLEFTDQSVARSSIAKAAVHYRGQALNTNVILAHPRYSMSRMHILTTENCLLIVMPSCHLPNSSKRTLSYSPCSSFLFE